MLLLTAYLYLLYPCNGNRVTAVDGQYQIGVYTVRPIGYGEEVTFDYNSVTEVTMIPELLSYLTKMFVNLWASIMSYGFD